MAHQDRPIDPADSPDWDALARLMSGEGSPEENRAARQAVGAHPAHAALVAALDAALVSPEVTPPTALEVARALAVVRSRRDARFGAEAPARADVISIARFPRRWTDVRFRAAAAALLLVGAGLLWRSGAGSPGGLQDARSPQRYASAVGVMDSLRLPDGSAVLLGPGSELTLGARFGRGLREVTLIGEARFDVVHDSTRPFVVHTPSASFRDIGTVFSVHSDAGDGARIVVSQGAVAVEPSMGAVKVTLRAGDRATVAADGALDVERASATVDDVAWTSGHLVFHDAPVGQVIADLRRWFGVELSLESAVPNRRLTATFERGARPADVGLVVAAVLGGVLKVSGDTLRVQAVSADVIRK